MYVFLHMLGVICKILSFIPESDRIFSKVWGKLHAEEEFKNLLFFFSFKFACPLSNIIWLPNSKN